MEAGTGEVVFVNGLVATVFTAPVGRGVADFRRLEVRAGDLGFMFGGRFGVGVGGVFSRGVVGGHGLSVC